MQTTRSLLQKRPTKIALFSKKIGTCSNLKNAATHCNTRATTHYNTLQPLRHVATLLGIAARCSALQCREANTQVTRLEHHAWHCVAVCCSVLKTDACVVVSWLVLRVLHSVAARRSTTDAAHLEHHCRNRHPHPTSRIVTHDTHTHKTYTHTKRENHTQTHNILSPLKRPANSSLIQPYTAL